MREEGRVTLCRPQSTGQNRRKESEHGILPVCQPTVCNPVSEHREMVGYRQPEGKGSSDQLIISHDFIARKTGMLLSLKT